MASVDNRVVRMEFDNRSFQQKIGQTKQSLEDLKTSLNFSKSTDSLKQVGTTANGINLNSLSDSVSNTASQFSILAGAAAVALGGIATQAISVGANIAKAFTIEPISSGFKEYETNMQSVQTILANTATKGTTLDDVNNALDKLNAYSDQTIYNFAQMAKNIGTFTAAGVDLDTSVNSIKGIANLAALSGSSAEQASTAMYQLSQAISTGSLKLMDWNSVTNAGMGGEAFKTTLFETAKAMGTLSKVPMGQSLAEWEDAGNSFRESLQDGWITSDVLTTALSTFTGDMNEEMLIAKGFSQEQATLLMQQAARAKAAATEVKTFTQLLGTVKEAIGTGWADSFKIIIGNFTEAKELWTSVNNVIGKFVGESADARNNILHLWKWLGGRELLINSLKSAFNSLGLVLKTIKEAFSNVFPPMTGLKLGEMTKSFAEFTQKLIPSAETLDKLKRIMQGVFSVFAIVWAVVKGVVSVFTSLLSVLGTISKGSNIFGFFAILGDGLYALKKALVDGEGIANFFKIISDGIKSIIGGGAVKVFEALGSASERVGNRFSFASKMGGSLSSVFTFLQDIIKNIVNLFATLGEAVGESMKNVKNVFSNAFSKNEFDGMIDALNVGLFGGLVAAVAMFVKNGLKLDLGNGLFENISKMFGELGDTLKAFQLKLKAEAIMKIAIAMAVLTASLVVLAMIDPDKLMGALMAVALGFALLTGTLSALGRISDDLKGGLSINLLVLAMFGLAATMILLAIAVKMFAKTPLTDIIKGILAMTVILMAFTEAAKRMPKSTDIVGMAVGIFFLGMAVKKMAGAVVSLGQLSWGEIVKGLTAFTAIMLLMTQVLGNLPENMGGRLKGMLLFSFALGNMAITVKMLGSMDIPSLAQGLLAFGLIMESITRTANSMPTNMQAVAGVLFAISVALVAMTFALTVLGKLPILELAKGVIGIGLILVMLSLAMNVMAANAPMTAQAILSILAIAAGLYILAKAIQAMSELSWGDLLKGLAMLGIVILAFALAAVALVATGAVVAMTALGISLFVLGAGLALTGIGVYLLASGIVMLVKAGKDGLSLLLALFDAVILKIPGLIGAFVQGLIDGAKDFLKQIPELLGLLVPILLTLIEKLREILPKFLELIGETITGILNLLVEKVPEFYAAGWAILLSILDGIRKDLPKLVIIVGEIIVNFLTALATQIPRIVAAGTNLLIKLIEGISAVMYIVGGASLSIITAFINGVTDNIGTVIQAGTDLIIEFIKGIGGAAIDIANAGTETIKKFLDAMAKNITEIADAALTFIRNVLAGLTLAIEKNAGPIREEGKKLAFAIVDGMTGGLASKAKEVTDSIKGFAKNAVDAALGFFGINSPSKVFMKIGEGLIEGFNLGVDDHGSSIKATEIFAKDVTNAMNDSLLAISASFSSLNDLNPVITPVLDLTNIEQGAMRLNGMINAPTIDTSLSFGQAASISMAAAKAKDATTQTIQTTNEIKFEQIINAPTELSTNDIYRNTKTQLSLAKEELKIL